MKTITFSLFLMTVSFCLYSQEFEVPENYNLNNEGDYTAYEQDVIQCFDWLMKIPINEQTEKRKLANAFLLKWLTGSPNVQLEIKQEIVSFIGTSPDLLMIFMGGWAKYSLQSRKFDDRFGGNKAGVESVIEFYKKNKKYIPKDKNVEKYIKMKEKGTLDGYIRKNT